MNYAPHAIKALPAYASSAADDVTLHATLAAFNARRLSPSLPDALWQEHLAEDARLLTLENTWLGEERARQTETARVAPTTPDAFVAWFENLCETGPGQNDRLFVFLAEQATLDQLRWFLGQEIAGEAGFDDLVALTQIRLPQQAKLELARNYWDEMGRGNAKGMHGPMLEYLAQTLRVKPLMEANVWQAPALNNLMVALATRRDYAYHALGALGVIELTAPGRSKLVSTGLRRLGVEASARHYFDLHATLDIKHSEAWNREALHSIVAKKPAAATAIAEGALMRLFAGQRCFERYRQELGIS